MRWWWEWLKITLPVIAVLALCALLLAWSWGYL